VCCSILAAAFDAVVFVIVPALAGAIVIVLVVALVTLAVVCKLLVTCFQLLLVFLF
jgi:hypothetical protein